MRPSGIKRLFRFPSRSRRDIDRDIRDEFACHLDMRVADLLRSGLTEADARAQAAREFGDLDEGAHGCARVDVTVERRRLWHRWAGDLVRDVRFALRLIGRNKAFSAVAVLTLAVAIGGNTTLFSFVNALVLKRLPVTDPGSLVSILPGESRISWPNYVDIRDGNQVFSDVAAHAAISGTLTLGDTPVELAGESVTANYFATLGAGPSLGRIILPGETRGDIVVLSDRTWKRHFGGNPAIVGRTVTMDRRTYEVIGIMPPAFRGMAPPGLVREFWRPIDTSSRNAALRDRTSPSVQAFARLKPGITRSAALASLRVLAARIRNAHPELSERILATTISGVDGIDAFRGVAGSLLPLIAFLAVLSVISALVLLVGCANLAGLLLARAAARRREIGVRLALGASRWRLMRQLLTESLVLALLGGAAGMLLARWAGGAAQRALDQLPFPVEFDASLDRRVLLYSLVVSVLTAVIFGLVPARRAARLNLVPALKTEGTEEPCRQWLRRGLVLGQVAACAMLLLWSGLFARSLGQVVQVDPGFDPKDVLVAEISLDQSTPDRPQTMRRLLRELQARTAAMPGVQHVGAVWTVPLSLRARADYPVFLPSEPPGSKGTRVVGNSVTPGWFETMRIRLLDGRDFTWQDGDRAAPVVMVNETLARRLFNGSAVGGLIKYYGRNDVLETAEVVGVVSDSKYWTLGETIEPAVYQPLHRDPSGVTLTIRTANPSAVTAALRDAVRALEPGAAAAIGPLDDALAVALMPARVGALVTAAFGVVAALLSMLGIYGLVSFMVAQRTREIGIRKAIGATPLAIVQLVVSDSLALVSLGLAIGLAAGALSAQLFGGLLVNVTPRDPITLTTVTMAVLGTALTAAAVPTLRALRIDAADALRAAD